VNGTAVADSGDGGALSDRADGPGDGGAPLPGRDDVVAMLASYGDRPAAAVRERIDSLELAWLIHQVEQRYGVAIDLDDDALARMATVTDAVEVLREVMAASAHE